VLSKLHTSSIVIDRYSNFGNTYLSKEFARVLVPGQIVTSLEHLAQCTGARGTDLPPHFFLTSSSVYKFIFNKISLFLYYFISFSLFNIDTNIFIQSYVNIKLHVYRVDTTGTRIPDPPFSSFGPSRDYGMDLCLEVYL
jgi:hypothetical protein